MRELVRTNNAVLITAIEALLKAADIPSMVLDQHMSVLEGSLGMLPRRIVVDEEHLELARQLLEDAGLAHELRPQQGGPQPDTGGANGGCDDELQCSPAPRCHQIVASGRVRTAWSTELLDDLKPLFS